MVMNRRNRLDFKENILPDLEILIHFSLSLTKNGRDAVELMRESMAEAFLSWHEAMPKKNPQIWLHEFITRRFQGRNQCYTHPSAQPPGEDVDGNAGKNDTLHPDTTTGARPHSRLTGESDNDVDFLKAFATLPSLFRSAMILSYLDGFSRKQIAGLTAVRPPVIESVLIRSRRFIREELFAYLMDNDGPLTAAGPEMGPG